MSILTTATEQRHERQTTEENEMEVALPSHEGLKEVFHNINCVKKLEAIYFRSVSEKRQREGQL